MSADDDRGGGLRTVAREAVRQRLSEVAIDLFAKHGFDAVTIEQVADGAGISARSVHRYFPSKEDMVIGPFEANGTFVRDALLARPTDEPILNSLHAAYAALLEHGPTRSHDRTALRLLSSTPSLRARNVEKHLAWAGLLTPVITQRLKGRDKHLRAHVLVEASLSTFQLALIAWADDQHQRPMLELLNIAFRDLEQPRKL